MSMIVFYGQTSLNRKMPSYPPPNESPWYLRFLPWLLILVGSVVVFVGSNKVWLGLKSRDWPRVPGIVRSSAVQESYKTRKSGSGSERYKVYEATLIYDYTVDAQSYTGDRISFGHAPSENRHAEQSYVDRLPSGSEVTVFYDPNQPDRSVLHPGKTEVKPIGLIVVGLVFIGGGIWMFFKFRDGVPLQMNIDMNRTG